MVTVVENDSCDFKVSAGASSSEWVGGWFFNSSSSYAISVAIMVWYDKHHVLGFETRDTVWLFW